jgi:hypothetical protein
LPHQPHQDDGLFYNKLLLSGWLFGLETDAAAAAADTAAAAAADLLLLLLLLLLQANGQGHDIQQSKAQGLTCLTFGWHCCCCCCCRRWVVA